MKNSTIALAAACTLALPALASERLVPAEVRIDLDHARLLADAASGKATAEAWRQWGDELRASMSTLYGDSFAATRVVKGAPYSAEVSTEVQQTLADGNVISRKTTGRVYRDSEGRTRQETVVNGETKSIQLRDPVAGKSWMLLPGSKTALGLPSLAAHADAKEVKVLRLGEREIRVEDGKVTIDGKEVPGTIELMAGGRQVRVENGKVTIDGREPAAGARSKRVIITRGGAEGEEGVQREEVRVHVLRGADGKEIDLAMVPMPALPLLPGPAGPHLHAKLLKSRGTTTALGNREFDGVRAEGKSTVRTIPAGEIGNRNPILITTETWYAPELRVTVFSRHSDPRQGETVYRLTNIRRAEPAADLFAVPESYKAADPHARG